MFSFGAWHEKFWSFSVGYVVSKMAVFELFFIKWYYETSWYYFFTLRIINFNENVFNNFLYLGIFGGHIITWQLTEKIPPLPHFHPHNLFWPPTTKCFVTPTKKFIPLFATMTHKKIVPPPTPLFIFWPVPYTSKHNLKTWV